jgi:hypothetical protein
VKPGVDFSWMLRKQATQKVSEYDSMLDNQSNNNNNSIIHTKSLRKQSTIKHDLGTPTLPSKKMNLVKKISLRS